MSCAPPMRTTSALAHKNFYGKLIGSEVKIFRWGKDLPWLLILLKTLK
jgi:hypothetical protein